MKKLFTLLISLLSFTFIVNATEEWKFSELKFSEDFGITAIAFDKDNNIIALGKEYYCSINFLNGYKCNVYQISTTGSVTKYDKYYDNTDNDFPGYKHFSLSLRDNKLVRTSDSKYIYPYVMTGEEGLEEALASLETTIHEDKTFNFLYCSPDIKEKIDICVVGVEGSGYGIINSKGEFLVEPSTNYSKAFDDYSNKLPILKDNNDNYVVVTANGKPETIEKAFLDEVNRDSLGVNLGVNIEGLKISNYDTNTNYYVYNGKIRSAYFYISIAFTKDKYLGGDNLHSHEEGDVDVVFSGICAHIEFINDQPHFISSNCKIYESGDIKYTRDFGVRNNYMYSSGRHPMIPGSIKDASYGNELLSYTTTTKNRRFYITDMKTNIVEMDFDESITGIKLASKSPSGDTYIYQEYKNEAEETWKPKYYILTRDKNEEALPITEEPTEKPKQVVEPKGIEDIEEEKEETKTYTCKRVDGIFYDKNGDVVTKSEYEKSCPEVVPDTGYITPIITISVLAGGILILRKKNIISKI